jgi:RNA polymerase sigma factor (sigma-70 family)
MKKKLTKCTKKNINTFTNQHYKSLVSKAKFYNGNEDDVQDAFIYIIKTLEKYPNKTFNVAYFHFLIKNTVIDKKRKFKTKSKYLNIVDITSPEIRDKIDTFNTTYATDDYDINFKIAYDNLFNKLSETLETYDKLDAMIFKLYINTGLSIKKLANELKINNMIIQLAVKRVKDKLKIDLEEDIEDLYNADYDKINTNFKRVSNNIFTLID